VIFKELFKRKPFLWRVRVEGKRPPPYSDGVFIFKLFDTPGNEVAPRSDVIGKYLKGYRFGHVSSSDCEMGFILYLSLLIRLSASCYDTWCKIQVTISYIST
jgi:hypothetical protein